MVFPQPELSVNRNLSFAQLYAQLNYLLGGKYLLPQFVRVEIALDYIGLFRFFQQTASYNFQYELIRFRIVSELYILLDPMFQQYGYHQLDSRKSILVTCTNSTAGVSTTAPNFFVSSIPWLLLVLNPDRYHFSTGAPFLPRPAVSPVNLLILFRRLSLRLNHLPHFPCANSSEAHHFLRH